ncbi:MauE/DoxX family redox-associated membrane protein [Streptomyces milbemycinicus]|uniref:MauE/DoxX family redox-associated membrane protein n=1 Tax=Streptomyces milbemycinicus TaxID=476552 RepID=A0ABW8LS86_9ACTN
MTFYLLCAKALIVTVFGVAFAGKVRSRSAFRQFRTSISTLGRLPARLSTPMAVAIVVLEGTTAVWLATPLPPRAGFAMATGLLLVFISVVVRAVRGGIFAECRCFGGRGAVMGNGMIVRNLLFLAFALPGALFSSTRLSAEASTTVLALTTGCALAILTIRYYEVAFRTLAARLLPPAREGSGR